MKEKILFDKPEAKWLFVSDVDDTLLGHNMALRTLAQALAKATSAMVVVYNSSRPCASLRQSILKNPDLPVPDYLIGALGTEIEYGRTGQQLFEYSLQISDHWDRERVAELAAEQGFTPHAADFQTPFKASYDVSGLDAARDMVRLLEKEVLKAKVIFSGGKNLDLIPAGAGKNSAIQFLRQNLAMDPTCVVVAGDSGNDREMFVAPHKGIIVANADADLKSLRADHIYHASAAFAGGVLEGLHYWGVLAY
jgi:sucrose-6F-phosphate phosphohydrolase